jgi:ribosomal protein S12 methylthiotransferase accessory factor
MSGVALPTIHCTPIEESLSRLERLVSPLTGVVRRLYEPLRGPCEPALFRIAAEATGGSALLGTPLEHVREGTGGAGPTRAGAKAAAIGEAVERYSAAFVPEEELVPATAAGLDGAVPPDSFALFSAPQYAGQAFPFRPFTNATKVSWVEGFSLPHGEPAYLPAQLVYLRDTRRTFGESPIGYATSNGLACGPTLEEAVLSGLLEALERDAFLLAWYGRLSLPRLDWSASARLVGLERRYFSATNATYSVVDLSAFHDVPTVMAVVRGSPPFGAFGVGAACQPTIEDAWRKALAEAFAVEAWARTLARRDPQRRFRDDFDDVRTFADHVHFYADGTRARRAAFLDESDDVRPVAEVEAASQGDRDVRSLIEELAACVERAGDRAYAVDVTSPDIRSAGLHVAKVIVPGFCQLDADYRYRFLGSERLLTAAWQLGLRTSPFAPDQINGDPHPFP